jgi:glycine cleavage system T protein (aminomethyltransferase)
MGIMMVGGLRDHPRKVIELLQLPYGVLGISGMSLGFAENIPAQRPRLPLSQVLHREQYQSEGRDALLKQKLEKPARVQIGFEMVEKGVAREHYTILHDGQEVGFVSSGMFSPTTKKYLGMGYVPREISALDTEIEIVIRGKPVKAKIVNKPFYIPAYRRSS